MNECSMNLIRMHYIACCHYHVTYQSQLHCFTANPLPWPHGIVTCPTYAHFRISLEEVILPRYFLPTLLWVLWT